MWILKGVVIFSSIILWSDKNGVRTRAAPLGDPYKPNVLFPQQKWTPPEKINDGQSIYDKIFVMKMINFIEWDIVKRQGTASSYPYLREYIYEGDIILTREQVLSLVEPGLIPGPRKRRRRRKRKMDVHVLGDSPVKKWTDMPIHYQIDPAHSEYGHQIIRIAIDHWERQTCINFTEDPNYDGPYLHFVMGDGCYSMIGKEHTSGPHPVVISPSCYTKGIISHEIGHSLGFWHEHSRQDRDLYVKTNRQYIMPGMQHNFEKKSWAIIDNLGVQYDVASVMHYNAIEFSVSADLRTIETLDPFLQNSMGQQLELSFNDVKLANMAYCNNTCDPSLLDNVCKYDGYQDPKNCSRCRCPDGLSGDFCEAVAPSVGECGKEVTLTDDAIQTISSPGYPVNYTAGLKCFWLIKSPEGTSIRMKFLTPYMHSKYCNSSQMYLPCTDFVEVRIKDNLASTGGRFCCDNTFQRERLTNYIYSHNNHTLILFKTVSRGNYGFKLELSVESCGGCFNNTHEHQRPCFRHVTNPCYQTWYSENVTAYTHNTKPDTRSQKEENRRLRVCSTEEPYCCDGYVLNVDNTSCIVASLAITTEETCCQSPTLPDGTNDVVTTNTSDSQADVNMTGWTLWSSWSTCTLSCGGCGTQNRTRDCIGEDDCTGDDFESNSCGLSPCNTSSIQTCSKVESYPCGFFYYTGGGCTKIVYFSQPMTCCCNYEVNNDMCVAK